MNKIIISGEDARNKVFQGIQELYDAVSSTLGPYGNSVIIERDFQSPLITKDGVTVARNINFKDQYKNLGVQILQQVASKTDLMAGDGTTTSTILACHLYKACIDILRNTNDKLELNYWLDVINEFIINSINTDSIKIDSDDQLKNVALISCNSDLKIADLIFKAFKSADKSLNIQVDINTSPIDDIRVSDGMKLFTGFCTPHFINKTSTSECEFNDPLVFITEDNLLNYKDATVILNNAISLNKPVLIFCPVCAGEALQTFVVNKERGVCENCVVTYPQYGVIRSELIDDLVAITGATPISLAAGKLIRASKPDDFGHLAKCNISINKCILTRTKNFNEEKLNSIINDIKDKLKSCNINEAAKYSIRLERLCSTIVEIMVGGMTELEVKERKDRIVDAVGAVRSALEEGIILGAGKELFNISNNLKYNNKIPSEYFQILDILKKPFELLIESAGLHEKYLSSMLDIDNNLSLGYNTYTKKLGNLFELGVVDPAKVTKTAVNNAFSVVKLLLNTNVVIINDK